MSRSRFWLLGLLSLVCVAGYSHCPCDGPEGIESRLQNKWTLLNPVLYEAVVLSMGNTQAVAAISGGSGQNSMQVFWGNVQNGLLSGSPQQQTLCTGPCYGLNAAMDAPCFGWMNGSKANVACYLNSNWTTSEVPGTYSNMSLGGNSQSLWGAFYSQSTGSYDFRKWDNFGGNWDLAFNYRGPAVHWDKQFGSIASALCATETDLLFSSDEIYTGQLNYSLKRFSLTGDVKWSRTLYRGSQPTGTNPYYNSAIADTSETVYGSFFHPSGPNNPGAIAYSVNGSDGTLNYARSIQQYETNFSNVTPSINLFLNQNSSGAIANVIVPTPDGRFNWSRVSPNGNVSTTQIRKQWDQTPWAGVRMLNSTQYLAAGSFKMPEMELQSNQAEANQTTAATLTVELLTLGSFLNFAQFADGGGLSSQIILTNTGSEEETVKLHLRDAGGADLGFNLADDQITIPGSQHSGPYEITLPAQGVRSLRTDGKGDVVVGSARVEASSGISAVIVFGGGFGLAGVGSSEALSRGFTAPMETDRGSGLNTGVAVMNLAASETTLDAELYSKAGALESTADPIRVPAWGQKALFVDQFIWQPPVDFQKFQGLLKVGATDRTAATVLQTRPGQFATMPVRPR